MATNDPFKSAEDEYFRLRGQLAAGRITGEQFEAALKNLTVEDAEGRHWAIGTDSGKWKFYDGAQWVEADPVTRARVRSTPMPKPTLLPEIGATARVQPAPVAPMARAPAPTPSQSRGGCGCRQIFLSCLVLFVLLILVVAALFVAFTRGLITQGQLLNLAGLGPSTVEVNNFRDDEIQVTLTRIDAGSNSNAVPGDLNLNAFDVKVYLAQNPGKYRVDFVETDGSTRIGTCTLTLRGGDRYQFVALPDKIVVNRANNPSLVGADLVVATSTLCRAQ